LTVAGTLCHRRRVPRYKLCIEYAGTRYSGWQVQKNARTVMGEINEAVRRAFETAPLELYGSGRTDAGVHALHQVAHLDLREEIPLARLRPALNDELPADIHILAVEKADHRFHARHSAVARTYLYQVSRRRNAFTKPFVWWVRDQLDLDVMHTSLALFKGHHDFRNFSDADPEDTSTEVVLDHVEVVQQGDLFLFRIHGSHFLWKMVRRIVGVVVEVGRGGLTYNQVVQFFHHESPQPAELTAPPSGLFLERVWYKAPEEMPALRPAMGGGLTGREALDTARWEPQRTGRRPTPHPTGDRPRPASATPPAARTRPSGTAPPTGARGTSRAAPPAGRRRP
jgi:tRNA pseudouridine38-40 synthase